MDTLDLIRTFREVAEHGSFSRAATARAMSKANVSKYVAELERRLAVRLFHRSTRSVTLTDAGLLLLERSAPLVEMIDLTRDELLQRAQLPSGRLRVTAPHALGALELPTLLANFMSEHPLVNISLDVNNRVVDLVDEGVDVALRVGRIPDSNLIVRKLRPVTLVVCAAPSYWESRGRPTHPESLSDHDALTYSLPGPVPEWRFVIDGELVAIPLQSRMDASDAQPLVHMALAGLGVICIPDMLVQAHLDSGALQVVLHDYQPKDHWLYAAYTQRRHNSAALKAFVAHLEARWRA